MTVLLAFCLYDRISHFNPYTVSKHNFKHTYTLFCTVNIKSPKRSLIRVTTSHPFDDRKKRAVQWFIIRRNNTMLIHTTFVCSAPCCLSQSRSLLGCQYFASRVKHNQQTLSYGLAVARCCQGRSLYKWYNRN